MEHNKRKNVKNLDKNTKVKEKEYGEDANGYDRGKDSSSADEQVTDVKPKRHKRWEGSRFSQTSLASGTADGGDGDDSEVNREALRLTAELVGNSEMLAWGRGGICSNTRHGCLGAGNGKNARNVRLTKLFDCFQDTVDNDKLEISVMLVSLDEQKILNLQHQTVRCRPTVSIRHLCQYVAVMTGAEADKVEMLLVKELHSIPDPTTTPSIPISGRAIDPCKDELHILEEHETLGELKAMYDVSSFLHTGRSYQLLVILYEVSFSPVMKAITSQYKQGE